MRSNCRGSGRSKNGGGVQTVKDCLFSFLAKSGVKLLLPATLIKFWLEKLKNTKNQLVSFNFSHQNFDREADSCIILQNILSEFQPTFCFCTREFSHGLNLNLNQYLYYRIYFIGIGFCIFKWHLIIETRTPRMWWNRILSNATDSRING